MLDQRALRLLVVVRADRLPVRTCQPDAVFVEVHACEHPGDRVFAHVPLGPGMPPELVERRLGPAAVENRPASMVFQPVRDTTAQRRCRLRLRRAGGVSIPRDRNAAVEPPTGCVTGLVRSCREGRVRETRGATGTWACPGSAAKAKREGSAALNRDRAEPHGSTPPTPPCIGVRTRRFDGFRQPDSIGERRDRAGQRRR